jgi:hypothetical protein
MLCMYLLCCFLVFRYVRFLSFFLAFQQSQVYQKWNLNASSIAFLSWEVLPLLHIGSFHTSPHLVFFLLTFLGVSLHKVLVLFISFSKSPSLLKMEFGCRRYCVFRMSGFPVLQIQTEIRSCFGLLRAEQWLGTRSGVQAGATPGSAPSCPGLLWDDQKIRNG